MYGTVHTPAHCCPLAINQGGRAFRMIKGSGNDAISGMPTARSNLVCPFRHDVSATHPGRDDEWNIPDIAVNSPDYS